MTTVRTTFTNGSAEAQAVLEKRTDLLIEQPSGEMTWTQAKGPFKSYQRSVVVDPATGDVNQTVDFQVDAPFWSVLLSGAFYLAFRKPPAERRTWWPDEVVTSQTVRLISVLAFYSLMSGFLGAIIGQEIAFIGDDMGISEAGQVDALAWIRVGIIIAIVVLPLADRFGRKPLIAAVSIVAIIFNVLTALFENLPWIISTQAISRAFVTAMFSLVTLAVIEQVPAEWRARGITAMTLAAGVGSGLSVIFLPLTDISIELWRVPFVASGLLVFAVLSANKKLEETSRFVEQKKNEAVKKANTKFTAKDKRNLVIVGIVSFCSTFFFTPYSSVRNTFLEEDLGWTGTEIGFFQAGVSIPAVLAVVVGGLLADRLTRKQVGVWAMAVALIAGAASYNLLGAGLVLTTALTLIGSGMAFPAIYGYKSELFGTRVRSKANGYVDVLLVAGSGLGLIATARLINIFDDIGLAISVLSISYVVLIFVFAIYLPETAKTELEDLSDNEI